MNESEPWICQCRKCHGVHDARDAVQYVWEFSFGACDVPVVVELDVGDSGHVWCARVLWLGEPDEPRPLSLDHQYLVSYRPGSGATPTEGDLAIWERSRGHPQAPREWLIADGTSFRSVGEAFVALHRGSVVPPPATIVGDWDGLPDDRAWREEYRATWDETVRRNQAMSRG
jgi:hypothetical protein